MEKPTDYWARRFQEHCGRTLLVDEDGDIVGIGQASCALAGEITKQIDIEGERTKMALSSGLWWRERAEALQTEIEKRMADDAMMQARVDELKEALRPFAEAVIAADRKADKAGFARGFDQYSVDWKFTFGEMRRAAAVARASDGGEDE